MNKKLSWADIKDIVNIADDINLLAKCKKEHWTEEEYYMHVLTKWINTKPEEEKPDTDSIYQVFEINDFFDEYGTSEFLVGAINEEDLKEHLPEIMTEHTGSKNEGIKKAKRIIKEDWRINKLGGLYTSKPYVTLSCSGYIE